MTAVAPALHRYMWPRRKLGPCLEKLDLSEIGIAAEMIACPSSNAQQICSILRKYIPEGYMITCNDVQNIKERAMKYYLEDKQLDEEAAEKHVGFKPLDENEDIKLPNMDLCHKKLNELMREAMNYSDTGCGFKALDLLE